MKKVIKVVVYFDDGTYQELNNSFFTSPPTPLPEPYKRESTPWPDPLVPKWPNYPQSDNRCSKCGIKLDGAMGYVCPNNPCPTGLGGVHCFTRDIV